MFHNKYIFAGIKFDIKSYEPLCRELYYEKFSAEFEKADYQVNVIKADALPEISGEMVFNNDRQAFFKGDYDSLYTVFYIPGILTKEYKACKINDSDLYITMPDGMREMVVFDALDLPSMLLKKGVGIIHSSFIEYGGEAILFVGDKQVGKSTQAALWEKHKGAKIINGDRAAIYRENGIFYADGIPFCGTSKICENVKLPIRAIVCPCKADYNKIEKLGAFDGFLEILGKFTYNSLRENVEKITDLADNIAANVPVYRYSCTKDETAVECLFSALFGG